MTGIPVTLAFGLGIIAVILLAAILAVLIAVLIVK